MTADAREPEIITFGCRLNAYESQLMREHARAAGLADAVIVNTCAVTAEAERQARQAIRKARRARPGARIIVTGCAAQIAPERYAAMPEVDQVVGNREKLAPETYAAGDAPRVLVDDIMSVRETAGHLITGFDGRARAFVQVQTGCDHRCTFCVIPFGRGPSRSVPLAAVVEQVRTLVGNGIREVVLTGVDLTAYRAEQPGDPGLAGLVRRLLAAVPKLARLRLSSLDPAEVDDALLDLLADEPRLMPHVHFSLQSGDDLVLARMKRRHRRGDAIRLCEAVRARRPEVVFGADLIAGFPTESEAMFAGTLDLIARCDLVFCHVFPFSARPGTAAARMPQVPACVRKERAARLREAAARTHARFLERCVGELATVLVEKPGLGRTERFAPTRLDGDAAPGALVPVRVSGVDGDTLVGEAA
jgi:threonylcarbamoyladenosine tRNA methylthiotransferase MtaB